MTIDRPNVATIWYAGSTPTERSKRHPLQQPADQRTPSGHEDQQRQNGYQPVPARACEHTNARSTAMSPWARLTRRITPNTSDSPVANSA